MKKNNKYIVMGLVFLLAGFCFAGGVFSPVRFYRTVSTGTWTPISSIIGVSTNGGIYTNGSYTLYYRVNGTNQLGQLPVSGTLTNTFTAHVTLTNAVKVGWEAKDGVDVYVVERSTDQISWTNWATVSPLISYFVDTGTNMTNNTTFEGTYPNMVPPSVVITPISSFPVSPETGTVCWLSVLTTNKMFAWDGAVWNELW